MSISTADESPEPEPVFHQLLFAWADPTLTSGKGVGPVAATLPLDDVAWWESNLGNRVWAPKGGEDGDTGLSYLLYGENAVVIRKRSVRDQHGRDGSTLAHVLVGPATALNPGQALGLLAWPGWITDPVTESGRWPVLRPVHATALHVASDLSPLRDALVRLAPGQPAQLITAILDQPGRPLAVIGAGSRAGELLCGVLDVVGTSGGPPCTYGTREEDDGDDRQWLVFLARPAAVSMHGARRSHVRLGDACDTEADRDVRVFAEALTHLYLRDGRPGLDRLRPPAPVRTKSDVRAWMKARTIAPGVLGDVMMVGRAVEGDLTGAEREFLAGKEAQRVLTHLLMTADVPALIDLLERLERLRAGGRYGEAGETWAGFTEGVAIVRCLHDAARARNPSAEELRLRGAARSSSSAVSVALDRWSRTPEAKDTTERLEVLAVAIDLGLEPYSPHGEIIERVLRPIDAVAQIRAVHSGNWPQLNGLLISNLIRHRVRWRDREGVRKALEDTGLLLEAINRLYPSRPDYVEQCLQRLLGAAYGRPITNPVHADRLISAVAIPSRTVAVVLHELTAPGSRARAALDRELAARYLDVGADRSAHVRRNWIAWLTIGAGEPRGPGLDVVTVLLLLAFVAVFVVLIVAVLWGRG